MQAYAKSAMQWMLCVAIITGDSVFTLYMCSLRLHQTKLINLDASLLQKNTLLSLYSSSIKPLFLKDC